MRSSRETLSISEFATSVLGSKDRHNAFTLVELVVVIAILAILGAIGFLSIGGYSSNARDSARAGDVAQIAKSLDLSIISAGSYPVPDNPFAVTYSGGIVWYQGVVGDRVLQIFRSSIAGGGLNKKPTDPLRNVEYTYSELAEGKAYQIKVDYEGNLASTAIDTPLVDSAYAAPGNPTVAYVRGNYGGLTAKTTTGGIVYVLAIPSIITNSGTTVWGLLRIESNALSGALLFNGKPLIGATSYNPNAQTNSGVVFSGATLPTGDAISQIAGMVTALKSAYVGSDITNHSNIAALLASSNAKSIQTLGTTILRDQLGVTMITGQQQTATSNRYPGCDTPDILLPNWQAWAACNVWAANAYTGGTLINCARTTTDCVLAYRNSIWGYYQWGRNDNVAIIGTPTTILASTGVTAATVGHTNFIQPPISFPYDWITTQNHNLWGGSSTSTNAGKYSDQTPQNQVLMQWPCVPGYHVPTIREWCDAAILINPAIICESSWQNDTSIASKLKLSFAGQRIFDDSTYINQGDEGHYWASSPGNAFGYSLDVSPAQVLINNTPRANAYSVRCIKN